MKSKNSVVVLGGPALDMLAQVPYFPQVDGNVVATTLRREPGGGGANIAVGLAHLGQSVALLGMTGADSVGDFLRSHLQSVGVDISGMVRRVGQPSQQCFVALTPEGERMIYGLPGATVITNPEDLQIPYIQQAAALHIVSAYQTVARTAIQAAREGGAIISYTPADIWWPHNPTVVLKIAQDVDILIVNRVEAAALTGLESPTASIAWLMRQGCEVVILTLGAEGVLLGERGQTLSVPAFPATGVSDTTGAGDAFAAGLVTGLVMQMALPQAVRLGVAVAALKLRESGAQAGLPSLEQALRLAMRPQGDVG